MYNIFWWRDNKYGYNFGDEIVPWLFNKIFDIDLKNPCSRSVENILLSVGSLLWFAKSSSTIWGTGILNINEDIIKPKKICSVRGLFSRQRLLNLGYDCPKIFGDPAILMSSYFNPNNVKKKYKLGIIPHIVDYNDVYKKYSHISDINIIDLKTIDIQDVIYQILSCERTISSALHGLVASVAYNIPTRWVKFSNKLYGDSIKFYDFFSSIDDTVFYNFDYKIFRTQNNIYNPILIDPICFSDPTKILEINTILYATKNINFTKIYESCPLKAI
jgi:pyruvyltransferase